MGTYNELCGITVRWAESGVEEKERTQTKVTRHTEHRLWV